MTDPAAVESDLADLVASCHDEPLLFVQKMYPWGEPGTMLEHHKGPDVWQVKFLVELGRELRSRTFDGHTPVDPILRAVSKGHGVGGSVMIAWLVDWVMSTRPFCHITVTANTALQLETKTWATLTRWTKLCYTGHWFTINTARMYHPAFKESWFVTPQTCQEENSEAFAGQHAWDSSSVYMFDEDSNIPAIIHTVSEGGLTDGEPMVFRFGNPTRNAGSFHEACFGKGRDQWHPLLVDSRTSRFTNHALLAQRVEEHGEDSDYVRVRIRGLPPRTSDLQFIDSERVWDAQKREVVTFEDEPLVAGVDFSGGGKAWNVVWFRRGMDARTIPPIRVPGEATRKDRSAFLSVLAGLLADKTPSKRLTMMFCDSAFGSPYVERLKTMGYANVMEIVYGGESPDPIHQANMRAYMWHRGKEWLATGGIPSENKRLETDLTSPGHHLDKKDRLVLESKESMAERGVKSPLSRGADQAVIRPGRAVM